MTNYTISIIICSQQKELSDYTNDNIKNTIGVEYEIIYIHNKNNRYSIFEAYNMGIAQSKGDVLCFQHDDIEYLSYDWGKIVKEILSMPNVGACAIAGANYVRRTPAYYSIGKGYNVINLIQKTNEGEIEWRDYSSPTSLVVFDGLWFCIKKECFSKIHFDSNLYQGFHFYDIDISTQLIVAGYDIMGAPDILIKHKSGGNTDITWLKNSFVYALKWKEYLPLYSKPVDKEIAIQLEYKALYSSFCNIIKNKQYKLLGQWFNFAMQITKKGPIYSLYIVYFTHRKCYV